MSIVDFFRLAMNPDEWFFDANGDGIKVLNFGCGNRKKDSHFGVDVSEKSDADVVVGLGSPLPFEDGSFDVIISRYVFEHVSDIEALLKELCRVLCVGGSLKFCVPHALSIDMYDDPTHCRFYTLRTMSYFTGKSDVHYTESMFSIIKAHLRLTLGWPRFKLIRYPANFALGILSCLAPFFSEHLLKLPFLTGTLYFELRKDCAGA